MMNRWIFVLAGASALAATLAAADDPRIVLALKAQSEFDHVALAATPELRDTLACVQTQASLLPVAAPEEVSAIHYHKGFCTLGGAIITNSPKEFTEAAAEFDKAIEGWPARAKLADKKKAPEPVPSALYVLASVARLNAGWDDSSLDRAQAQIVAYVENSTCSSSIMPAAFCGDVLQTGRQWLGWIELRHHFLEDAARYFGGSVGTG